MHAISEEPGLSVLIRTPQHEIGDGRSADRLESVPPRRSMSVVNTCGSVECSGIRPYMVRYVATVSFRKAIPHIVIRAASAGTASFKFHIPNAKSVADIGTCRAFKPNVRTVLVEATAF